jgi:hypothetical protein
VDIHNSHSSGSDIEIRFPNSGENLAMVAYTGSMDGLCVEIARAWYNQVNDYDFVGIME